MSARSVPRDGFRVAWLVAVIGASGCSPNESRTDSGPALADAKWTNSLDADWPDSAEHRDGHDVDAGSKDSEPPAPQDAQPFGDATTPFDVGERGDASALLRVTWVNARGGSGTATGTRAWSIANVPLLIGKNDITVTAQNGVGIETTKRIEVTYQAPQPYVHFIDPSASQQGSGTLAAPYNTWNGITFEHGHTYLQRRGTVFFGGIQIINRGSGSAGQKIILGAYRRATDPIESDANRPRIIVRTLAQGPWTGPTNGVYVYALAAQTTQVTDFYASTDLTQQGATDRFIPHTSGDANIQPTVPNPGTWSFANRTIYYRPDGGQPAPGANGVVFNYRTLGTHVGINVYGTSDVEVRDFHVSRAATAGLNISNTSSLVEVFNVLGDFTGTQSRLIHPVDIGNGIHVEGHDVDVYDSEGAFNEDNGMSIENIQSAEKPYRVRFFDCYAHHNNDMGLTIRGSNESTAEDPGMSHGELHGCLVEHNGREGEWGRHGVKIHTGYGVISGNTVRFNAGAGIKVYSGPASIGTGRTSRIENNLVYGNSIDVATNSPPEDGALVVHNYGDTNTIVVTNNTFVSNYPAIHHYWGSSVMVFRNNIFMSRSAEAVVLGAMRAGTSFDRNNHVAGVSTLVRVGSSAYASVAAWNARPEVGDDQSVDPAFFDAANDDYHLRATSALIDDGENVGLLTDLEGRARTDNPDIGAYEFAPRPLIDAPVLSIVSPTQKKRFRVETPAVRLEGVAQASR